MIPLSSITARVRTRFEAESAVRWSDSAIHEGINEGLDELSEITRFYERVVSIPVLANRNFYDLRDYLPDDFIDIRAVWSTVRSDWLTPTSEDLLDPRWEEAPGDPYTFFTRGFCWLGIYPHAASASGYLRVYFSSLAPQLTHPQAVLADLPDDFTPALEDYAIYDLHAQDGETQKALLRWKDFAIRQAGLGSAVSNRGRSSGNIGGRR